MINNPKVIHISRGLVAFQDSGYDLKGNGSVVAFYLDVDSKVSDYQIVCRSTFTNGTGNSFPSITISPVSTDCQDSITEICFPEFPGWIVHSVCGGKTLSVCLIKDN